jgi:predicted dehydrogenase
MAARSGIAANAGDTELERQIHNWYHYIWLCGDHICEQHVHNIDVCNWIMGDKHPVKCWGMGARQQLGDKSGEIWDNFAVEFEYANGVRMHSYCGQIKREWSSVSEAVHGSKGTANPNGQPSSPAVRAGVFRTGTIPTCRNTWTSSTPSSMTRIERGQDRHRQHAHRHHGPRGRLQRRWSSIREQVLASKFTYGPGTAVFNA